MNKWLRILLAVRLGSWNLVKKENRRLLNQLPGHPQRKVLFLAMVRLSGLFES